jgi:hypothetical protein
VSVCWTMSLLSTASRKGGNSAMDGGMEGWRDGGIGMDEWGRMVRYGLKIDDECVALRKERER